MQVKTPWRASWLLLAALCLAGCGNKGPLVHPDAAMRAAAAPAATATPPAPTRTDDG